MKKAKRGFGSRRIAATFVTGSLAIALAGCGGMDAANSGAAAASATSPSTADTSTAAAATSGSTTTTGSGSSSATDSSSATSSSTTSGSGSTSGSSAPATPSTATAPDSSVTLGWQAPTQNTDGSPITDLAGYKIHYGTAPSNYTQIVAVSNAGLSRYVVDNLPRGTYYFTITAYNSKGIESDPSTEASITVN
jgi:hypothetical protein